MKLLWISALNWLDNGVYEQPPNGPGAVSSSLFQQELIERLCELGCTVDILCDCPTTAKTTHAHSFSHSGGVCRVVSSLRLPIISRLYKYITFIYNARKINAGDYDIAVVYLVHSPYLSVLKRLKKSPHSPKTVLIAPDLPDMMDMSLTKKPVKRFLKSLDSKNLTRLQKSVDRYVLFTKAMAQRLAVGNKPQLVLEGVYCDKGLDLSPCERCNAVLHAGTLHRGIGIEQIIEAWSYIKDESLELWLFGDGELRGYIEQAAARDKRIKFYGFVDRKQLFLRQKQARLLINARSPESSFTKYSFPSKTFEYMVSATPFMTTRLEGIPDEYYPYLLTLENNKPETIAAAVENALRMSDQQRDEFGLAARSFVQTQKNGVATAKKLLRFLKEND